MKEFALLLVAFLLAVFLQALIITMLKQAVIDSGRVIVEHYLTKKAELIQQLEERWGGNPNAKDFTHN